MMNLHQLLARQLADLGLAGEELPSKEQWRALLEVVSRAYGEADQHRSTVELLLASSSRDQRQLYDDLKRSSDSELAAERDKLSKSVAVHEATLEASSDGVLIVSVDRKVVGYNQRFVELWKLRPELVETRDADRILATGMDKLAHPQEFLARVRYLHQHIDESSIGEVLEFIDGRVLERDSAPVQAKNGSFCGRVWFFRDITERRRAEARIRDMKEAAELANRTKSDFLRNMSHEMRTPLNAILGFARVLRRTAGTVLSPEQQSYLQDIVDAGGYMLQLVNDLLDLRNLEENRLHLEPLVLEPLIAQSVSMVRPLVHDKHLDLSLTLPPKLPRVLADRRAVVQILVNLLSNAGKFTPPGGSIAVTASVDGAWVEVAVKDTGSGIAPEHQERLFVYFEQLGGKGAAHMKGSGVGLALTRSLIEKQGGSIKVDSALGRGSTFRFRLQAVPA